MLLCWWWLWKSASLQWKSDWKLGRFVLQDSLLRCMVQYWDAIIQHPAYVFTSFPLKAAAENLQEQITDGGGRSVPPRAPREWWCQSCGCCFRLGVLCALPASQSNCGQRMWRFALARLLHIWCCICCSHAAGSLTNPKSKTLLVFQSSITSILCSEVLTFAQAQFSKFLVTILATVVIFFPLSISGTLFWTLLGTVPEN